MIGAFDAVNIVAVKLLPLCKLFRIGRQRTTLCGFERPVAATAPRASAGVSGRPELVASTAAHRCDVFYRQKRVDQNLTIAILHTEAAGVAERLFAVAARGTLPIDPWHIDAVQQPCFAERGIGTNDAVEDQQDIELMKIQQLTCEGTQFVRRISTR